LDPNERRGLEEAIMNTFIRRNAEEKKWKERNKHTHRQTNYTTYKYSTIYNAHSHL